MQNVHFKGKKKEVDDDCDFIRAGQLLDVHFSKSIKKI